VQQVVLSPHIVSRDAFDMNTCYIYVDNQPCFPAADVLDAFLLLIPVYYVLWLSYPRKANATWVAGNEGPKSSFKVITHPRTTARLWIVIWNLAVILVCCGVIEYWLSMFFDETDNVCTVLTLLLCYRFRHTCFLPFCHFS